MSNGSALFPRIRVLIAAFLLICLSLRTAPVQGALLGHTYAWRRETVRDGAMFAQMKDRSLHFDSLGHPHIVYGADRLYHAWRDTAWHVEVVDNSPLVGRYAMLDIDSGNHLHVVYYNEESSTIEYAVWDGAEWSRSLVGSGTLLSAVQVDGGGSPHIAYFTNNVLKYASLVDGTWSAEIIDDEKPYFPASVSLSFDSLNHPFILYHYSGFAGVYMASRPVDSWQLETVSTETAHYSSLALTTSGIPYAAIATTSGSLLVRHKDGATWADDSQLDSHNADYPSLAIDPAGYPAVSFENNTTYSLEYYFWSGTAWTVSTLDSDRFAGLSNSLAFNSALHPAISYHMDNTAGGDELRYAIWNGSEWTIELVDTGGEAGFESSLAFDSQFQPHIMYNNTEDHQLQYAVRQGGAWQIDAVEDSPGGARPSLALDTLGRPHVSYREETGHGLKYAAWNGTGWSYEIVDALGFAGWDSALDLDGADRPHIVYACNGSNALKYAYWTGSAWAYETIDSDTGVSGFMDMKLDTLGRPHVYFFDTAGASGQGAYYAIRNEGVWTVEFVDGGVSPDIGRYGQIAVDSLNQPHLIYEDWTNRDLKYGYRDGTGWHLSTLDPDGIGDSIAIAMDSDDNPYILYTRSLYIRLLHREGGIWTGKAIVNLKASSFYWGPSIAIGRKDIPSFSYLDIKLGDLVFYDPNRENLFLPLAIK